MRFLIFLNLKFYIVFILLLLGNGTMAQLEFDWAVRMGAAKNDIGYSVAVDASGNVYTTGSFGSIFGGATVDFDPGPSVYNLTSAGNTDIFISKLDASGNFVWAKRIGGVDGQAGTAIKFDGLGNIYIMGNFTGTVDFDPGSGVYSLNAFYSEIFILKLDAFGNFIWVRNLQGFTNTSSEIHSIVIDLAGNVFMTGELRGNIDFDPSAATYNVATTGSADIFISCQN